jgi:L-glyceraldehyde 3-phosphate reductase
MFERWVEDSLLDSLEKHQVGCIPFSPLAQGLLTNKYLNGVPDDSRWAKPHGFLNENYATPDKIEKVKKLNDLALERNQTLAQMAIAWLLKDDRITTVLVGASKATQLADSLKALENIYFEECELKMIEDILKTEESR